MKLLVHPLLLTLCLGATAQAATLEQLFETGRYAEFLSQAQQAAAAGDAEALLLLGKAHHTGKGARMDWTRAREFYEQARQLGVAALTRISPPESSDWHPAPGRNATFFVLGENLQARLDRDGTEALARLYADQCMASHGWEHRPHTRWDDWQHSLLTTRALLHSALPQTTALPMFRPPYGQRMADSGAFFTAQGIQVALWNLDSQDWRRTLGADAMVSACSR